MTDSGALLARHLRAAGLADQFDAERRRAPAGYEVWPGAGARPPHDKAHEVLISGLAAYRGHGGTGSDHPGWRYASDELCALGVLRADGTPGSWALTGHRGLLAVQDRPAGAGPDGVQPAVYIGPDSFRFVDFLLAQQSRGTALEVGCGSGIASCALAVSCDQVTAIDVVPQAVQAAQVSARLNGVADRVRPLLCSLTEFTPSGRYSVVAANLPGVPVPRGIAYSPAGDGGPDGLRLIRRLLERLPEFLEPDGMVLLRLQSLTGEGKLLVAEDLRLLCAAHGWDGSILVEGWVPAAGRAALTARYATDWNPGRGYPELFAVARDHLAEQGADGFASCAVVLRGNGRGGLVARGQTGSAWPSGTVGRRLVAAVRSVGREPAIALALPYYAAARLLADEFWELGGAEHLPEPLIRLDELLTTWSEPHTVAEVAAKSFTDLAEKDPPQAQAMVLAVQVLAEALLNAGILAPYAEEES